MEITKFEAEILLGTLRGYIKVCSDYEWFKKEDTSHYYDLLHKLENYTGIKKEN